MYIQFGNSTKLSTKPRYISIVDYESKRFFENTKRASVMLLIGFTGKKKKGQDYKLTSLYSSHETKETDIRAGFGVTPQPGVPPKVIPSFVYFKDNQHF
jgi:hypothetical protein